MSRFEGTILISTLTTEPRDFQKIANAIVGKGGSVVKQLTSNCPGLFVKVFSSQRGVGVRCSPSDCDAVHISARTSKDVQTTAQEIGRIARSVMDGTKRGFEITLSCPVDAVGTVIGSGGSGIARIQEKVADQCNIHYNQKNGNFEISASSKAGCERAKIYIADVIKGFYKAQAQQSERQPRGPAGPVFNCLPIEGEEGEGEEDDLETAVEQHQRSVFNTIRIGQNALELGSQGSSNSIQNRKQAEVSTKERWDIRKELSTKTDSDGYPLYPTFTRKDRTTLKEQRVEGVHAVPWRAVDEFIAERQAGQQRRTEEWTSRIHQEQKEKTSWESRRVYETERHSMSAFPSIGGGSSTVRTEGWGSKPSSINSGEGVVELNEVEQRKPRFVPLSRKSKKGGVQVGAQVDLSDVLPSLPKAPRSCLVDLTAAMLPTGPRVRKNKLSLQEHDYRLMNHLGKGGSEQDYWIQVHIDEGDTSAEDEFYGPTRQDEYEYTGGEGGEDWWNAD